MKRGGTIKTLIRRLIMRGRSREGGGKKETASDGHFKNEKADGNGSLRQEEE